MTDRVRGRLATAGWAALLVAVTVITDAGVLRNGFVWDDGPFIVRNEALRDLRRLPGILVEGDRFGTGFQTPYYRPVTTLTFALDSILWGANPAGHHATNLLLHLGTVLLLFLAALRLTGGRLPAGVAALLFAVHPATAEPVAYVAARADLLCAGFMLAALLLHLGRAGDPSPGRPALATAAFALALFAKIVALVLLPLLLLRELLLPPERRRLRALLPFGAVVLVFLAARALVLERTTWGIGVPLAQRLATAGTCLVAYLGNVALPYDLKVFYTLPIRGSWSDPAVIGSWGLVAAIAALWLAGLRRSPAAALGVAWFFAGLLPVCGVVELLWPAIMADRYLYVSLAGAALALAAAVAAGRERLGKSPSHAALAVRAVGCVAALGYAASLAIATSHRLPTWRDDVTFWEQADRDAPDHPYVLNALGWAYKSVDRLDEAERAFERALQLAPQYVEPEVNLAAVGLLRGDLKEGAFHTERALALSPRDATALRYRAVILESQGRIAAAIESLRAAVAADPFDAHSRRFLDDLLQAQGGGGS